MAKFEVWAPKADRVAVKVSEQLHPMTGPDERGYWHTLVEQATPGTDYAFVLNDDAPIPDPRSRWQPEGVHGPSRLYDHSAFAWHDQHWNAPSLDGAVVYEMHVGTFTPEGTFGAAIGHIDHLTDLGVTHVEIMPVSAFPGTHGWGYDGVAIFAVQESYGGPEELKRLVDACHTAGLAVLLDVVYNHFGPSGNYTGKFAPYTTEKHHTPWGAAMNFEDEGSDEVRRFFSDNALMWMRDYHIDGLRLDAVHAFVDRSAIHFMEQLAAETANLSATIGRRLVLIAESDLNDPRVVTPREAGGLGMDAQWSDDFHHALFTLLHPGEGNGYYDDFGSFADLAKALKQAFVYDGNYSGFRRRSHGRPVDGLSAHHFLGFIQNHDQIGNRATGDRLEHIVGLERAKVAAGLVLMSPFVPMLFQGEEYAASTPFQYFADHDDPELAKAVSAGRKREFAVFGWNPESIPDPEKRETFERSRLNWAEVHEGSHEEMFAWTKALIALRRSTPSLNDGDFGHVSVEFDEKKKWLTMNRGTVRVLCNLGSAAVELENPEGFAVRLASQPEIALNGTQITLPPDSLVVLVRAEA
jgi:maltooligosyltrehalose trehalohydrolase